MLCGTNKITFLSKEYIEEGSFIEGSAEGSELTASNVKKATKNEMFKYVEKNFKIDFSKYDVLVNDEVMAKVKKDIVDFAKNLFISSVLERTAILRFNNDADGIVSGFAINEIIKTRNYQHNSAVYTVRDALNDLQILKYGFIPLLINVDFGCNEESKEGIELITAGGVEVMIIDHHPCNITGSVKILNPSKYTEEPSKYTTGYLCYEILRALGKKFDMVGISLAGDKSTILEISEEDRDKALVLDFISTYSSYGNNLVFYKEVLKDRQLFSTILLKAKEKLEEVKRVVLQNSRKEVIDGVEIYFINVDKITKKSEFPSRGKVTSQAYELLKDRCAIMLGISQRSIIFRITDKAVKKGLNASHIINSIKEKYGYMIISGGGHAKAAALLTKEEYLNVIIDEIKSLVATVIKHGG